MTAAERWAAQQEIERTIEREMIVRARGVATANLERMEGEYSERYGESARTAILESTSGVTNEQAQTLLDQGGYLDPYQTFDYATRITGTDDITSAAADSVRQSTAAGGQGRAMSSGSIARRIRAIRRGRSTGGGLPGRTRISCGTAIGRRRSR